MSNVRIKKLNSMFDEDETPDLHVLQLTENKSFMNRSNLKISEIWKSPAQIHRKNVPAL